MSLAPGVRLGPYEILSAIGAGGMGEVYRARDTKLNRDVAIKILPDSFAADADRIARFRREAQVLASLNHPNIAHIYGFEDSQGIRALVLEFVDGPTLADRIARGPIAVDEALPVARQIAEGLEAAHELGIVHRDLKPANIKVTGDGIVKVLDFGLARAFSHETPDANLSMSPTITSPAMTARGVILGTAAYMSPEQAKGKVVDKRTDIWAFGCVLYEMLTGKRAFGGDDVTDTLAEIIKGEPDWSALPSDTPSAVQKLIVWCLKKDRKERAPDIAVARFEIGNALTSPAVMQPGASDAPRNTPRSAVWQAAAVLFLMSTVALGTFAYFRQTSNAAETIRFSFQPPDGWSVPSDITGGLSVLAVSRDGRRIAFVAQQKGGKRLLWVRQLDVLAAQPLTGTDEATSPFWSPDGRYLGFFADGKLKKIAATGGPAIPLCDAPDNRGGTWNQDGVIIFSPGVDRGLLKVSAAGGVPVPVSVLPNGELGHGRPMFLPDGRHFLYRLTAFATDSIAERPIYVSELGADGRTVLLKSDTGNFFYSNGHLLFLRGTTLMAQPFDVRRLELVGEPFPIAEQVRVATNFNVFAASESGLVVYQSASVSTLSQLTWFDRSGKQTEVVGEPGTYRSPRLSPDGKRVVVESTDSSSNRDLFVIDLARQMSTRFTFDAVPDNGPVWAPDGSRIAWVSGRLLLQKSSSGGEKDATLAAVSGGGWAVDDWAQDISGPAYLEHTGSPPYGLWVVPSPGNVKPRQIIDAPPGGRALTQARVAPNGHLVAYVTFESGKSEVYVQNLSPPVAKSQISVGGGLHPTWRGDGKELFYLGLDGKLMAVPITIGPKLVAGVPKALFAPPVAVLPGQYDVTSDGQRFLVNTVVQESVSRPFTVVVNWAAGLKN